MAATLKLLSLLFLISTLSSLSQARDSQFFSKEVRYNTQPTEKGSKDKPDPSPTGTKQEEQPTQVTPESETNNGYGLYASHVTQEYPATEYYTPNNEFSGTGTGGSTSGYPTKELENAEFTERYPTKEYENAEFTEKYPTREYETRGRTNTYPTKEYETVEPTKRYTPREYGAKGSTTSYPTKEQQYGMSDTRFLENGRYFYDVNGEARRSPYGSAGNTYEYNNYKGGYENSRQVEQEEEYVP